MVSINASLAERLRARSSLPAATCAESQLSAGSMFRCYKNIWLRGVDETHWLPIMMSELVFGLTWGLACSGDNCQTHSVHFLVYFLRIAFWRASLLWLSEEAGHWRQLAGDGAESQIQNKSQVFFSEEVLPRSPRLSQFAWQKKTRNAKANEPRSMAGRVGL